MYQQQPKVEVGSRHNGHTVRDGSKTRKEEKLAYHHEHKEDNRNDFSSREAKSHYESICDWSYFG